MWIVKRFLKIYTLRGIELDTHYMACTIIPERKYSEENRTGTLAYEWNYNHYSKRIEGEGRVERADSALYSRRRNWPFRALNSFLIYIIQFHTTSMYYVFSRLVKFPFSGYHSFHTHINKTILTSHQSRDNASKERDVNNWKLCRDILRQWPQLISLLIRRKNLSKDQVHYISSSPHLLCQSTIFIKHFKMIHFQLHVSCFTL